MPTISIIKKRLREIDRRVRYLTKCMENLKIVDYSPQQEGKVFFGAWVEIENDEGDIRRFRIVGYDEIFGRKDYISIDSPMARALLKKEVGDLAVVHTPAGEASWYVNEIEYVKIAPEQSEAPADDWQFCQSIRITIP
ncbi:transcription elongation factor GreB [Citrobacter koseri]|uniref:Transcription elongation factor GreB n=1 Tax=Citrobacter koseri TaxID=545 RepID=A0A447ULZ3_CITKO|nr:transcription elongation factor GreB [Citrobacter koseri]